MSAVFQQFWFIPAFWHRLSRNSCFDLKCSHTWGRYVLCLFCFLSIIPSLYGLICFNNSFGVLYSIFLGLVRMLISIVMFFISSLVTGLNLVSCNAAFCVLSSMHLYNCCSGSIVPMHPLSSWFLFRVIKHPCFFCSVRGIFCVVMSLFVYMDSSFFLASVSRNSFSS